jgi:hypothetical protein
VSDCKVPCKKYQDEIDQLHLKINQMREVILSLAEDVKGFKALSDQATGLFLGDIKPEKRIGWMKKYIQDVEYFGTFYSNSRPESLTPLDEWAEMKKREGEKS